MYVYICTHTRTSALTRTHTQTKKTHTNTCKFSKKCGALLSSGCWRKQGRLLHHMWHSAHFRLKSNSRKRPACARPPRTGNALCNLMRWSFVVLQSLEVSQVLEGYTATSLARPCRLEFAVSTWASDRSPCQRSCTATLGLFAHWCYFSRRCMGVLRGVFLGLSSSGVSASKYIYAHTYLRTYVHTYMHVLMHMHTQNTYTYSASYLPTRIHTYTFT